MLQEYVWFANWSFEAGDGRLTAGLGAGFATALGAGSATGLGPGFNIPSIDSQPHKSSRDNDSIPV
jgi:hypothetical protein